MRFDCIGMSAAERRILFVFLFLVKLPSPSMLPSLVNALCIFPVLPKLIIFSLSHHQLSALEIHTKLNAQYSTLCSHILRNPGSTWHDVPELPKTAVAALDATFAMFTTKLVATQNSSDGDTTKLLIELQDGLQIESVIMAYDTSKERQPDTPQNSSINTADDDEAEEAEEEEDHYYSAGEDEDNQNGGGDGLRKARGGGKRTIVGGRRSTLCVSSEVGCTMGCTFCATGTMGLIAELTSGEIIEQLVHARQVTSVRNIVFMGMGEPLNNYVAVKNAVELMTHGQAFALRRKCVTVSTVGVIPRILQLADDLPGVSLALSLHAPTQELRSTIVPSARAYKLDKLMEAIATYQAKTKQRVFIEYVMLGPEVNCLEEHARKLGEILQRRDVVINLIPWNPILSPGMEFAAPAAGMTAAFQRILKEEYGLPSTIRQEKGQDVAAACGQLVLEHGGAKKNKGGAGGGCGNGGALTDVEDLLVVS